MKVKEKRHNRGYKAADNVYNKALKRGAKTDVPLAKLLEKVVEAYSKGQNILAENPLGDNDMVFLNADTF